MIEIKNLHKSFGKNNVLRGINLNIGTGETIVIIGKSEECFTETYCRLNNA